MCGIFGTINSNALEHTYMGLSRLEYRDYDSFGYVAVTGGHVNTVKRLGPVDKSAFDRSKGYKYDAALGATCGEPTLENVHPQQCKTFYVVHNGIVDTKWLANLIELNVGDAEQIYNKVEGDNAFVFINKADGAVWCVAKGNKRLYVTPNGYVSSELHALSGFSEEAFLLENTFRELRWERPSGDPLSVPSTR